MNKKQMQEKLARLATQMRALRDTAKKENRGLKTEERTQWDNLIADFESTEEMLKAEEKLDGIDAALKTVPEDKIVPFPSAHDGATGGKKKDESPHAKAFSKFLRGGMGFLDRDEQTIMQSRMITGPGGVQNAQTLTTTGGGYLIPQGFSDQLEEALKWFGGIIGEVETFDTETGNPLPWPTENDTANKGRILAVNTQLTETDLTFGQVTFNAYIGTSDIILVPLALMQDSYFNLDSHIARKLGERLGRLVNNMGTVGSGTNQPTGIQTAAVAAGNTTQGATGTSTSVGYSNLVDLLHLVDPAYRDRPTAKFMFHDSTLKVIRKLLDSSSRPLWQPGISAGFGNGFPPTILDKPYVINNDMPVMAASANALLFGDLSKYKLRRVAGGTTVMRLTERYADFLQVGFLGFMRFDGNLIDAGTHPVGVWQNSAT